MKILAKALRDDTEFEMMLELLAGAGGLGREIGHPRIQKPGLALAGFVQSLGPSRVQVLGKTEVSYLQTLDSDAQQRAIEFLYTSGLSAAVVTTNLEPPASLVKRADELQIALFRTSLSSGTFIGRIHNFLEEHMSPEVAMHGVLMDVFGVGVMLTGQSGIGKSECALDLILRSHRLVSDDVVVVRQRKGQLVGMGSPITRHHMEVRGLGIINVQDLFGAASVREKKRIELIVEMVEWHSQGDYDRTGVDEHAERVLDVQVPKVRLPIRPGRNVASIVEVAARNHLLKLQGHNSAQRFKETLERRLQATAERETLLETE